MLGERVGLLTAFLPDEYDFAASREYLGDSFDRRPVEGQIHRHHSPGWRSFIVSWQWLCPAHLRLDVVHLETRRLALNSLHNLMKTNELHIMKV